MVSKAVRSEDNIFFVSLCIKVMQSKIFQFLLKFLQVVTALRWKENKCGGCDICHSRDKIEPFSLVFNVTFLQCTCAYFLATCFIFLSNLPNKILPMSFKSIRVCKWTSFASNVLARYVTVTTTTHVYTLLEKFGLHLIYIIRKVTPCGIYPLTPPNTNF